jgi:hypothetical protein
MQHADTYLVLLSDWREPVVREVDEHPVGFLAEQPSRTVRAGAGLGEKAGERDGEAVECHLEEFDFLRRDVGRRLGAVRQPVDVGQGQREEADAGAEVLGDGPQPGDVPRRGEEGDGVPTPGQLLGKLEVGDDVAEREPWEHHEVQW